MRLLFSWFIFVSAVFGAGIVAAQVPSNPYSYSRTSAFEYDPATGMLTGEKVEPDNPSLCVNTTYSYDQYGNKTLATQSNCAGASGTALFATRSSSSQYSAQNAPGELPLPAGAAPTVVYNALNKSETKFVDPRFGALRSQTGPNQLTTKIDLDDFGRTVRELRADGTSTVTAYCFVPGLYWDADSRPSNASVNCPAPSGDEIPADAFSFVQVDTLGTNGAKIGKFVRLYSDRAGRSIRTVTEGYDNPGQAGGAERRIVQDTDYNALGAAIVKTQPYFLDSAGSASYGMTYTEFDVLGRAVRQFASVAAGATGSQGMRPFGTRGSRQASVTTMIYDGGTVKTVDDQGHSRFEEKDIDGKVVRVTDALGAQVAFQFDAFGNLLQSKDPLQNTLVAVFDVRGRKTQLSDPDSGLVEYQYNALGELVWQRNANQRAAGQATTMTYDLLGRMTQRIEPEYVSNWIYDSCDKGVGKLCESNSSNGVRRRVFYDALGRPSATRTDISAGPSFASAVAYDPTTGRVAGGTYPSGMQVNYAYSGKGFLRAVTLGTTATVSPMPATPGGSPAASTTLPAGSVLWQAQSYNAWGKAEQQLYGNGVASSLTFDDSTGQVKTMVAGRAGASDVLNYTYGWDSINQLVSRADSNGDGSTGAVTDDLAYDELGRLRQYIVSAAAIPNLARTVTLQYNALGSILYRSDVGAYTYGAQGAGATRPHALQSVSGAYSASYTYDANGNVATADAGGYRSVSYTSFNLPDSQNGLKGNNGTQYTWQYDSEHQRIKETRSNSSGTRVSWLMHPDNAGGLSFEREEGPGLNANRHYLSAGGATFAVFISSGNLPELTATQQAPAPVSSIALNKVEYWHTDHLGSLASTTDHAGTVTARYSYDPFGKRRAASGTYDANGNLVYDWNNTSGGTDRGFTGHEHLDDVGVIHMNGRLYDPRIGMFMQADPFVQDPMNLQNFNRYGYCYNNPMTCTDPTGQLFGGMFRIPVIDNLWNNHIKPYAPMIASIVVAVYMPQSLLQYGYGEFSTAAITGFTSGAVSSGNLKGALQGALTASMFYGAGSIIGSNVIPASDKYVTGIVLHGVVGCASSVMSGGKCGPGALSAAFSKAALPFMSGLSVTNGTIASAMVGGTASVLGGGKFANGAMTGSFGYLFNCILHECMREGRDAERTMVRYLREKGFAGEFGMDFNKWSDGKGNNFGGRPDIFSKLLEMVWDVKPYSAYGQITGEEQVSRYMRNSGYSAGTAGPVGLANGGIILSGDYNRYEFFSGTGIGGTGGIIYYHTIDPSHAEYALRNMYFFLLPLSKSGTTGGGPLPLPPVLILP